MQKKVKVRKAMMVAAAAMAVVIPCTGAAVPASSVAVYAAELAVQPENSYESFLGIDSGFAFLNSGGYNGGNVNMWSGNLVVQYTLPHGNLYRDIPLTLTYNSQADCDIGFGQNVVISYWAKLTFIDADTVKLTNQTGTVDTFVKNAATGRYEKGEWFIEQLADGSYHADSRGEEYYFDQMGRVTQLSAFMNGTVLVTYNEMGYVDNIRGGYPSYQFHYEQTGPDTLRCVMITSNYDLALHYDAQGNLVSGQDTYSDRLYFSFEYGADHLMSSFRLEEYEADSVHYQTVDGCRKVSGYNGTQIVYGKNQTIAIAPDGTVTNWQFDDDGNLLAKA